MLFFRPCSRYSAGLLGVMFVIGMAAPARAVPQRLTFAGPLTSGSTCFSGHEMDWCSYDTPGYIVSYTLIVDFDRLGETIVRDASGEAVTPIQNTFFAEFPGTATLSSRWSTRIAGLHHRPHRARLDAERRERSPL